MILAQKTNSPQLLTKEDYLQKSKHQRTTGWIFRGSGAVLFGVGIIWGATTTDDVGPSVLALAGGACIITSVPFFMAAKKNKRRAMEMSFDWQQSTQLQKNMFVRKAIPSLTLRMGI